MTEIADETGRVLLRNEYNKWNRLIYQEFEDGAAYSYRYDWSPTGRYFEQAHVMLQDQTTKDLSISEFVPDYVKSFR